MPKKVKGKSKGKGKTKGKGKGKGKGKKKGSKKTGDVTDKETLLKEAINTAKLWEARYNSTETSRLEYRRTTQRLIAENESLQTAINSTEKDTIEVITFLKKKDTQKDDEMSSLKTTVRDLRQGLRHEWNEKEEHLQYKIANLEKQVSKKDQEIAMMQTELKTMREFRRNKAELQEQLDTMQEALDTAQHEHKQQLTAMEQKFFEEKIRLQKEANRRIEELALKAHSEAVSNLDEHTRDVYRENITMGNALSLHMTEEQNLRKEKATLEMSNRQLAAEKELSQQLAQGKVQQAHQQKRQIQELESKVFALEQSLTVMVREFEKETEKMTIEHKQEMKSTKNEVTVLTRQQELQKRETAHIRRLARQLLDQRTELEQFFIEALGEVKKEIVANRLQYKKNAEKIYNNQIMDAVHRKRPFPPIRTFHPSLSSTNSVYHDMAMAEQWESVGDDVDISELTWEQKEQVLRLLFAKMNQKDKVKPDHALHSARLPPPPPIQSLEDTPRMLPAITGSTSLVSQPIERLAPPTISDEKKEDGSIFITQQDHTLNQTSMSTIPVK